MKVTVESFKVRKWKTMLLFSLMMLLFSSVRSAEKEAEQIQYLYFKPYFFNQADSILKLHQSGKFTSEIEQYKFFPGTSVWIYIPSELLLKEKNKPYLLSGYQDVVQVYSVENNKATLQSVAGKYLRKSEVNEVNGRYFTRLYAHPDQIKDGFLIVYKKLHDTNHSDLQATLSSKVELDDWYRHFVASKSWMNIFWLISAGMAIFAIVFMLLRYSISRELSHLYYAIWMVFFSSHFVCMYFQFPLNNEHTLFDSLRFNLVISHSVVPIAVGFILISFKHFHNTDDTIRSDFRNKIGAMVNHVFKICVGSAIIVIAINYFTSFYALGSIAMQLTVGYIFVYLVWGESIYRLNLKNPVAEAYAIIIQGSIIHLMFFFSGYVIGALDYIFGWGLGLEVSLTFAALAGFTIHNFIAIVAYNKRDNEILIERNLLHTRSVESELKFIQSNLNPHFIFNSLELVDSMMMKNDIENARAALFDFSDLLRMVVDKSSDKLISLKDEIKMADLYLNIEERRNSKLDSYQIQIQEGLDVRFYRVPPLIIQPLVENSIRHGIAKRKETDGGSVIVKIGRVEDEITFEIEDNGIGFRKSDEQHTIDYYDRKHIGLEFTKKRIALLKGIEYKGDEIELTDKSDVSGESGTIVKFRIPIIK